MQKTSYEMRISDWNSDVCSSDLFPCAPGPGGLQGPARRPAAAPASPMKEASMAGRELAGGSGGRIHCHALRPMAPGDKPRGDSGVAGRGDRKESYSAPSCSAALLRRRVATRFRVSPISEKAKIGRAHV